ncbi:hypothetical protein [Paraburkholderia susongensis]|uniref:DUF1488 domain-containing protein n=1 Tax=Paraburkholderia susongensis TaxID=1515439 RepID=A0A1X7I5U7_9BURK|nr:hypothetical protein [Paraburkholderia susongensis]SMG09845.1 hypothetical protein SAMN06265784_101353 [Paraburkholderia susongensis]
MANPFGWLFVRDGNDVLFNMAYGNKAVQVRVTHEALCDALGSSGSMSGDEDAIINNRDQIFKIALAKANAGEGPPIVIRRADLAA